MNTAQLLMSEEIGVNESVTGVSVVCFYRLPVTRPESPLKTYGGTIVSSHEMGVEDD